MFDLTHILLLAPPILMALTFHEVAHGYIAYRLGDPTAKMAGRLTLNPLPHLDPIGTIMLFIAHIGWAKPVPVNPFNLANPKRDMIWISLAGPASNLILAFFFGMIFRMIPREILFTASGLNHSLIMMLIFAITINLVLCFFNLIPIPPLDGSKILMGLLPPEMEARFAEFERIGPMVLMGLIVMGMFFHIPILWMILKPFLSVFSILFAGMDLSVI